jgi:D-alanyl-D-alanine dipeptidase
MSADEYCEMVERKHRRQQQRIPTIPIRDDDSPLISLLASGCELIFEPSISPNYKYLVRAAVYEKIVRISQLLSENGKVLIIRSAWRSFEHQQLLWNRNFAIAQNQYPKKDFDEIERIVLEFTAPKEKSMHATGGAVDALIYDSETDCVMDFGTNSGYKIDLNNKCYPWHPDISPEVKKNRRMLITLFENEGFVCDLREYWHFDYGNVIWAIEKGKELSIYDIVTDPC